ncbi:arginine--tRNA ligase [Savagea sp. SN6]|uniref:Arginine--tRNA ligase n=1 Tax=Savagea serpentis TaxID=2785297 RepID=A0A8J7KCG3_9BACL|nr:arginine--tRNA ligase [Savagea serpentis]MBF4501442.1 arginine--tRNA ligase [Savagea serpentis]
MNAVQQVEEQIKATLKEAVIAAQLTDAPEDLNIHLETPRNKEMGDYATNVAMQLTKVAKRAPRQIAEAILEHLPENEWIESIEIAGPGFMNIRVKKDYLADVVKTVLEQGEAYGRSNAAQGEKVQVEFVSANPTGDLHLGHARGASLGDSLCNILDAAGYDVYREYYINDAGNQIDNLAMSIDVRYAEALGQEKEMPEDGYRGADIIALAQKIAERDGDKWLNVDEQERLQAFRQEGLAYELGKLKEDLANFRVSFDRWYSETSLYESGKIDTALDALRANGHVYEEEGATWFRSTTFGDDKDRVLIKQDGSYTYLTPDIAYHKDKLDRGFEKLINIWGADHHGYIPRMQAAIEALGYDRDTLEVEVVQMVQLFKDGEIFKMSKRTGKAVTLRELVEDVGLDAVRYFFAMRSGDTQMDFDLDLAVSQSNENPVYYAQYAHARIASILRQAAEQNMEADVEQASLLTSEKEIELMRKVGDFPQLVSDAARARAPHRITTYVQELSSTFHSFYNAQKVIDAEQLDRSAARLALVTATKQTIANALRLVGVAAPEKM